MAIRNIRTDGDDILRKVCKPVKEMTPRIEELIDDMFETMYNAGGVGLAAPQVGVLKRIVVIDVMDGQQLCLINPEIVESDGEQVGEEGCLSLPGLAGEVARPNHVVCKALDRDMNPITVEGTELLARCICHELDHLDGVLYKDLVLDGLHSSVPPEEIDEEDDDE
jgi:peptide deformylase